MHIEYVIKYSNRKTFSITVERDRQVVVHSPKNLSEEKIKQLVDSKRELIQQKLNHVQKYPTNISAKEFVSGESLMFLGKSYQLLVVEAEVDGIQFNKEFKISKNDQSVANELFKKWYKKRALEIILPLANEYAENLGVKFSECKISEMKYRWGSCTTKNNINFNWRIIKAPLFVIKYIIVHELIHLIEANHTATFWNILSIQVPDYQRAKDWLKNNGHLLEVDF